MYTSTCGFRCRHLRSNIQTYKHPSESPSQCTFCLYVITFVNICEHTHTHLQVCNAHIWTVQCKRFIHPHARYHVASCSHKVDALDFGCGGYQSFDADIGRPRRIKRPPQSRTGHCLNMRARSLLPLYDTNCTVHGEKI